MRKEMYVLFIGISLSFSVCFSSFLPNGGLFFIEANDDPPPPFFEISFLVPNTGPMRHQYVEPIVEELRKIGIGVETHYLGWAKISPRTWGYPGPYPIPTYAEGGYDILVVGWAWDRLEWDPKGLFDTASWVPKGNNFYQYSNPLFDDALTNYYERFLLEDRIAYAKEMQQILYEDQPAITICYHGALLVMNEQVSGMDSILWEITHQPMEQWAVEGDTELHYATLVDMVDFHILCCENYYDAHWLHQIYNGLVERENGTHKWTPRLATNYSSSKDGFNWTVHLNPHAKWADGEPVTAEDVVFSYQAVLDPALNAPEYSLYTNYFDNSSITALDNHTVQFTLKEPYTFAESLLALDLIPKHIWEPIPTSQWWEQAEEWAQQNVSKLIGAGPYKLKNWNSTQEIIHLEKNPYFAELTGGEEPKLEDIFFEFYPNKEEALVALMEGTIDVVDPHFSPDLEEIMGLPNVTYQLITEPGFQEMAINCQHPYLGTGELCPIPGNESAKHIRKAMSHVVPREKIVKDYFYRPGSPGITPMPSVCLGADTTLEPYNYSPVQAKEHMRAAGFIYPEDTRPSKISVGIGENLSVLLGIITLLGGCYCLLRRKKKKKKK